MGASKVVLYRSIDTAEEESICGKYFKVEKYRSNCKDSLVIGRYSVLPFYHELEQDLHSNNSYLINSYDQHRWIANFEWYDDLKDFTFPSYTDYDFYKAPEDAYIVKGRTNSRKFKWNNGMFAPDKKSALLIANELMSDPLIGPQGIIYRKYIPLKTLEIGLNELPITYEFRYFFYQDQLVDSGYYWSNAQNTNFQPTSDMTEYAKKLATIVKSYVQFFVLDIAETSSGDYILVEINDGQMSGLSCIDPDNFYKNLYESLQIFSS